jgi:membrane protein DedA with SNARE-associated domain
MYEMKHSILVATPSWGDVYIAGRSGTTVLLLFWNGNRVLSPNELEAASAWLKAEGWFAYASGLIGDADQEVLKLIDEA